MALANEYWPTAHATWRAKTAVDSVFTSVHATALHVYPAVQGEHAELPAALYFPSWHAPEHVLTVRPATLPKLQSERKKERVLRGIADE